MSVRRVVTGFDADGRAVVTSDDALDPVELNLSPGLRLCSVWGSDTPAAIPTEADTPDYESWFPPPGGYRFTVNTLPPDADAATGDVASGDRDAMMVDGLADAETKAPGLMEHMEPDNPGFHTSDTVDLLYVASGAIVLELDDGVTVPLSAGDTLVQYGTRHAWRNPHNEPCTLVTVSLGARRR